MADILADAQRWLDSLAARNDDESAAQDAVWVIEQSIAEIERLRAIEAAAKVTRDAHGAWGAARSGTRESSDALDAFIRASIALYAALEKAGAK